MRLLDREKDRYADIDIPLQVLKFVIVIVNNKHMYDFIKFTHYDGGYTCIIVLLCTVIIIMCKFPLHL